jgi:hypothetical protein
MILQDLADGEARYKEAIGLDGVAQLGLWRKVLLGQPE